MDSKKYLEDISQIKDLMSRSSRFISLSGLSGILAGVYALIGAALAGVKLSDFNLMGADLYDTHDYNQIFYDLQVYLISIATIVVFLAIFTGIFLSRRKAKRNGEKLWDESSKRLVINFLIPLITGGLFCIALLQQGIYFLIAPVTLVFYGLACVNASKYTLGDVRQLGIAIIVIGLVSTQFIGYGLYFWALGFGVFHIVYGALMYFKHDKKA